KGVVRSFLQLIVSYFANKPLLKAKPLGGCQSGVFLVPDNLLPGAMFRPCGVQAFGRKILRQCIPQVNPQVVLYIIDERRTKEELIRTVNEVIGLPVVDVCPDPEFVAEPGLSEISHP